MDNKSILDAYTFPYKERRHPEIARRILGLMYSSNQKQFTLREISANIGQNTDTTAEVLEELINSGPITCRLPKATDYAFKFELNIKGLLRGFRQAISDGQKFTQLLERTIEKRDNSNTELNEFIESSILMNSELADFVEQKVKEYFTNKSKSS